MLTRLEEWETSLCQIVSKLVYPKQRYCDFSIFQMAAAAMFYFYNRQLFWQTVSRGSRLTSKSNFCKIDQSVAKILRFFQFFKMAGNAILDVQICEISLAVSGRPRLIIVLNVVKIGRLVVKTTHFFEFSKWPTPPSWIFEIAKFYWLLGRRGSRHISMPNFVKIGQSVAKILRFFFDFFKMAAAAILDCQIHKILLADSSRRAQTLSLIHISEPTRPY